MKIKLLVMDVDGTLTDGKIYVSSSGECMKAFNVKDGYAIANLKKHGITPVIITGRSSEIVIQRAKELHINELHQGIVDKLSKLKEIAQLYDANPSEFAYIGDDLNDLDCINYCGVTACPNDGVDEVKNSVVYVCKNNGGKGAVREFIEYIINGVKA